MRKLTQHVVEGDSANHQLNIEVLDEPGQGGACHDYVIQHGTEPALCQVQFQNGPIKERGVNGITHEALLAILIDRMEGFQSGPYACPENEDALNAMREASAALKSRTEERISRAVEGTHAQ